MRSTYNYHISEGSGLFESWFYGEGTVVLPTHVNIWKVDTNNKIKYLNRYGEIIPEDCPYVLTYTTTDGNPIDHEWEGDFIQSFNDFGTVQFAGPLDYIYLPETYTLQSITIPNGTLSLLADAFNNCFNLQSVVIPNSVDVIEPSAFYFCSSLTDITYLGSVEECENAFLSGIDSAVPATYVQCADGRMALLCELKYTTTDDQPITPYNLEYKTSTFENGIGIIGMDFFQTYLPSGAFESYTSLKTIELSDKITEIGSQAFAYCSSLETVDLGKRIEILQDEAFYECSSLTSITIPNSVTIIGYHAFYGCSSLSSVTIGNSVTSIEGYAFRNCPSLPVENNLRYADTYLVEAIDKTLSTYSIKEGTKWIGYSAFSGCSSLTSVTIPNSVTSIGWYAFSDCSSLTSITIPNSVTKIEGYAFHECFSLTSLTCEAVAPPILDSYNIHLRNLQVVYVPAESVEAYKQATNWSYYSDIIQAIP